MSPTGAGIESVWPKLRTCKATTYQVGTLLLDWRSGRQVSGTWLRRSSDDDKPYSHDRIGTGSRSRFFSSDAKSPLAKPASMWMFLHPPTRGRAAVRCGASEQGKQVHADLATTG